MIDLGILLIVILFACFLVVAINSAFRGISHMFWRLATLFGYPLVLLNYGIVRELIGKKKTE